MKWIDLECNSARRLTARIHARDAKSWVVFDSEDGGHRGRTGSGCWVAMDVHRESSLGHSGFLAWVGVIM